MRKFIVDEECSGRRADVFIANQFPDFTRSSLLRLFKESLVTMEAKPLKASSKLKAGDEVLVDETYLFAKPAEIDIPVLYEDSDVIVIDKPSGLLTHSKGALNLEASVASFIAGKVTDKQLSGNRAGIVHRLDRGTSGVIITARTKAAQDWLQKQFSKRNAKKTYLAIVHGEPRPAEAIIEAAIMRSPTKPQTFKVNKSGKQAVTQYKVLKTAEKKGKKYSLVEFKPLTGRTHQLRVHMNYIGHPIVGDHVYGQDDGGTLLHASSLELTLPSGERKKFISKTPASIEDFFDAD